MIRACPALLVSAPASGQGKTSVTAALARAHARLGRRVRVFKTGPDFLDPMILARASGAPVYQLDAWMGGEDDVRARLYEAAGEADLILVEGVMGLFDGSPSSADLAARFGLPVLAVIDGSAMAQTFGALAHGLATYRHDVTVHGVLANRVGSDYHAKLLRESLPPNLTWHGHLRRSALARDPSGAKPFTLPERHLGLVSADELADLDDRLDALADALAEHSDLALPPPVPFAPVTHASAGASLNGKRIAVARDAAFAFIYPANVDVLRQAGAEVVYFSPLAGDALPACDAVWLPGGYPELHLDTLAARTDLRAALHAHVDTGRPLLAECGGLLYALDALSDREGHGAAMAGLLRGTAAMQTRMAALGMQGVALPEGELRGHSFHYARAAIDAEPLAMATNPNGGPTSEAVYRRQRMTASFVHFYFPSNPDAAARLFLP
ncbi:cobyrinate a,c-diamide synthase [Luteibacter aegosomaticola]|uniref:cobyrinate a,c-diamide synthase n=1 Tax=Luteibacter aegosomaticola TaxID=2911538 RepID=UPI001FFAE544|nr:cobyrinate a,c-diamide synthase [Luteibacter aegosomaticola]UPG89799.1 cobyrinate a,c-diamide synthase [Luteibacter aegosomaticola]